MYRTLALLLILAAAAVALRWPALDLRPVHADEAVHLYKLNELRTTGRYTYDPAEFHGPTLYYATLPVLWLRGIADWRDMTAADARVVTVIFGAGLVLLLALLADGLGRLGLLLAGALTAASPGLVYYSRYYIQETLLVFFTLLAIGAGWRYVRTRRPGWAILAGAALGLMHATKETAVLAWAAMITGVLVVVACRTRREGEAPAQSHSGERLGRSLTLPARRGALWLAVLAVVLVSVLFFSGFGTNPRGPLDAFRAYAAYADRAGGGGHAHPWYYYLLLLWPRGRHSGEIVILIYGLVGLAAAFWPRAPDPARRGLARFLAVYVLVLAVIYSAIPYKTPWCVLGLLHGLALLGGLGVVEIIARVWGSAPPRRIVVLVAVMLLIPVGTPAAAQAWRGISRLYVHPANRYAYVPTTHQVEDLARYVEQLADLKPAGRQALIRVIAPNPWPLPWYLRRLPRVGYWENVPENVDADVIIAAAPLADAVEQRLHDSYAEPATYAIRPNEILRVYVAGSLRAAFEAAARRVPPEGGPR